MVEMSKIDTLSISKFCRTLREYFSIEKFNEISLFDTTKYFVSCSKQIRTDNGEYLRSTTEPDIWELGVIYNSFFCVTSLFRDEVIDSIHKNEFKVLDFYQKHSSEQKITRTIFQCLEYVEDKLELPKLSSRPVVKVSFEDAKLLDFSKYTGSIIAIEQYPVEESFFDEVDEATGKTKKGELFFAYNGDLLEFAVYGQVGENRNLNINISDYTFPSDDVVGIDLYGGCLGIERTLGCYELLKQQGGGNDK